MDNMEFWGKLQTTPQEARKPIQAGRLKGMTDINPMWRFKMLTQVFGPCGIGWKYRIVNKWTEKGLDNEIKAFVEVNLSIKHDGEWSEPIPGVGGSSFVTVERNGPYCSDECYKMALTDAISVCCKALGMSADIYFEKDRDKYTAEEAKQTQKETPPHPSATPTPSPQGEGSAPGRQTAMGYKGVCRRCKKEIDQQTEFDSMAIFGLPLCPDCQRAAVEYKRKLKEASGQ